MIVALENATSRIGNELGRNIMSDIAFESTTFIPLSENYPSGGNLNLNNKEFKTKKINELDFTDILILIHDADYNDKIDQIKTKTKYLIEILSPDVGTELFIFGLSKMDNFEKNKHFWIPSSFTIAISKISSEISKILKIKSIFASGYNSASNEKNKDINNLYLETKGFFEASILDQKKEINEKERLAFNCIPKIGNIIENNSTDVEDKIEKECKFFFQQNKIPLAERFDITVNLNKVPVFRGDAYFIKIEFEEQVNKEDLEEILSASEEFSFCKEIIMTQAEVPQINNIYISRLKVNSNYISFYLTFDNIKIVLEETLSLLKILTANKF